MALRIQQGNWERLDGELRQCLIGLTIKPESGMRDRIRDIKRGIIKRHKVFVLFENELPVSWSLVSYDDFNEEYDIMVYTRWSHRRRGYGRKLVWKARRWIDKQDKNFHFFSDDKNYDFWLSMFTRDDISSMGKEYFEREVN